MKRVLFMLSSMNVSGVEKSLLSLLLSIPENKFKITVLLLEKKGGFLEEMEVKRLGIIYQKNKKTGITYAYRNEAYWDKEKKQSRAKRTLIGKVDPVTGDIVPTRAYRKKQNAKIHR